MKKVDFEQPRELEDSAGASETALASLRSAKKGSGPRTPGGKATASKNALTHGIFAKAVLLKGESRSEYDSLFNGLREYLQPEGTLEEVLAEKLAILIWRYRRIIVRERDLLNSDEFTLGLGLSPKAIDLNNLPRYETTIDRAFDRTLTQLERLQRMRLGQPVTPPIKVDISSS